MTANSKTNLFSQNLLKLIFQNVAVANIGNAGGLQPSSAAGSLYFSLHTADPGETGTAITSEAAYTGYARVPVARTAAAFPLTGQTINPAAAVTFGNQTAGGATTITHAGIVTSASGAGDLLYFGAVTPNISMNTGVTPSLTIASSITED